MSVNIKNEQVEVYIPFGPAVSHRGAGWARPEAARDSPHHRGQVWCWQGQTPAQRAGLVPVCFITHEHLALEARLMDRCFEMSQR